MSEEKLVKQVETLNKSFHKFWYSIMFNRPKSGVDKMQKLSFMEMYLISLAYDNPDMILKEIREILKVPQTTLSSIVAKLEKLGYIRRVINHRDMRSFSIEVTEQGKEFRDQHRRHDLELARMILLLLDKNERDTFVRLFHKVSAGIVKAEKAEI